MGHPLQSFEAEAFAHLTVQSTHILWLQYLDSLDHAFASSSQTGHFSTATLSTSAIIANTRSTISGGISCTILFNVTGNSDFRNLGSIPSIMPCITGGTSCTTRGGAGGSSTICTAGAGVCTGGTNLSTSSRLPCLNVGIAKYLWFIFSTHTLAACCIRVTTSGDCTLRSQYLWEQT
jgi:hypothetical protein